MAITKRSAKNKGKRLEQLIRDKIIEAYSLTKEDIRIPVGSENGADLKMSHKAKILFPFSCELKARKSFDTLYGFYEQAQKHDTKLVPLVIIKADYKHPLAILDFDHFLSLISYKETKR